MIVSVVGWGTSVRGYMSAPIRGTFTPLGR
jgi:hypothetical protein